MTTTTAKRGSWTKLERIDLANVPAEPIQRDKAQPPMALCNDPALEEVCPRCNASPGFLCRYTMPRLAGQRAASFHRARIALTYTPSRST